MSSREASVKKGGMGNRTNAMVAAAQLSFVLATSCSGLWLEGAAVASGERLGTADFFVSGQGRDTWSGKQADPGGSDGPFATVARAREAVQALLKTRKEPGPVRVILRGGTYYLDAPLELGPEDSGTEQAPVVYSAAAGERVVLSGGRRLRNGHRGEVNGRKAWVVDIPEVKAGTWRFRQLFVNGERRPRTRLPGRGEYRIESLPGYTGDFLRSPTKQFVYAPGDIVPTWRNLQDAEVVGITRWLDNRLPIESVSGETRTVTFDRPSLFALVSGDRPGVYWVENVFEALDTPGQWYLDRPRGALYYLPRPGEEMPSAEIIAPVLPQIVRVVGREGAPVHDLRFEGLIFAHTEWQPPADYASSLQAGIEVPGALLFDYAERCSVTGGRIEHIGNYGIEVGVGCVDIEITHNRITDIGAGGIRIGHFFSWETDGSGQLTERGLQRKAAMPQGPHSRRITVADNEIAHGGRFTPEAVGVFVGDNADNQVVHNHIYDLFYSGISVGSVQDFGPGEARGNIVEYNHVHDIGQGVLSDMGGIYACSTPDSRIAYNVVHDVVRRDYGGWGIYPDEGCHDLLIEKNLVYRCQDGALFAHHNRNITARNNVFALSRGAQVERGGIGGFELTCRRNLIYYREGKAIGDYGSAHCGRDICAFDRNLYWNASGQPVLFAGQNLSEWQATGQDKDSLIADPLFVDPAHGDFRLRPGSPAAQIGFEPWDMSAVGPRPLTGTPPAAAPVSGMAPAIAPVGKHKTLELVFTAAAAPANPFDSYLLKIEVTDPAGETFRGEGFYDGDGKPGNYGDLPEADRNRLLRYVMARTSAYSHLWYVLCFEWQEAWTRDEVNRAGTYLQAHNPWRRLISVHDWAFAPWAFSDQSWPSYIAAQCGNDEADLGKLSSHVTSLRRHAIPVLADEFGILTADSIAIQRSKLWAVFCVGLSPGAYRYEWFDPAKGRDAGTGNVQATGGRQQFTAPFEGDAVLYLRRMETPQ
jgi:hypothetical protein